ncbi:Ubiquitin-like-specific protease, putative [Candida maltosa Xu316]|uniref:Ubiquitin-like-specific protease, putative n=1 Tax=Candida maltosa (strain Xu316) TaxID=1245528 RepID=M3K6M3_CANMX|nr:Ubiquitin-like-specific protease, putative [Candida maltosa Xu316]
MGSIIYDEHKGYCLTNEDAIESETTFTNGLEELPWDIYLPDIDDENDPPTPTVTPKKISKSEKREAKQMKKINASRRRKMQREQELDTNGTSVKVPEFRPFLAKRELKSLFNSIILNTCEDPKKDSKILQYHSIALYKSDLEHILPGEWLNDNNISLIYELISNIFIKNGRTLSNQIQLLFPSVIQLMMHLPDDVEGFLPVDDLKKSKFIFLPINFIDEDDVDLEDANNGDHWALGVLSLLDNTLYFYDSMQIDDDEVTEKQLKNLANKLQSCKSFVHGKIKICVLKCDQQRNFDDCGVYVIMISCYLINQLLHKDEV